MNPRRHLICIVIFLQAVFVSLPVASGAESGFQKYRESVLKQIEESKASLKKDPSDPKKHFQLGLSYMALGRHEEEIAEYLEAVRLQPDFAEAHYNLGLSYDLLENGPLAVHHMLRARQIYSAQRNHRGIRTSQRYLRTFFSKYGIQPEEGQR